MYLVLQNRARALAIQLKYARKDMPQCPPPSTPKKDTSLGVPPLVRTPKASTKLNLQNMVTGHLDSAQIINIKKSWAGPISSSDLFDVVGDSYDCFKDAIFSSEFWNKCSDELQLYNVQIPDPELFKQSHSSQIADIFQLIIQNLEDLDLISNLLSHKVKDFKISYGYDLSHFDALPSALLGSLYDSFTDALTSDLLKSWRNLTLILVQVIKIEEEILSSKSIPLTPTKNQDSISPQLSSLRSNTSQTHSQKRRASVSSNTDSSSSVSTSDNKFVFERPDSPFTKLNFSSDSDSASLKTSVKHGKEIGKMIGAVLFPPIEIVPLS